MGYPDFEHEDTDSQLDEQLHQFFAGIEKPRTLLSGSWYGWMQEAMAGTDWQILGAWDNGDGFIHFSVQDPNKWESVNVVNIQDVCRREAFVTFARLQYDFLNEPQVLFKQGHELDKRYLCKALWYELASQGLTGELLDMAYEDFGGLYAEHGK